MIRIIIHFPYMKAAAMALFPFILIRKKDYQYDEVLINHEMIHLQQQWEMLILPFYFAYILNYFYNLIKYRNHHDAYFNICFEKEAYFFENNLNYLKHRKIWSFMNHI